MKSHMFIKFSWNLIQLLEKYRKKVSCKNEGKYRRRSFSMIMFFYQHSVRVQTSVLCTFGIFPNGWKMPEIWSVVWFFLWQGLLQKIFIKYQGRICGEGVMGVVTPTSPDIKKSESIMQFFYYCRRDYPPPLPQERRLDPPLSNILQN